MTRVSVFESPSLPSKKSKIEKHVLFGSSGSSQSSGLSLAELRSEPHRKKTGPLGFSRAKACAARSG